MEFMHSPHTSMFHVYQCFVILLYKLVILSLSSVQYEYQKKEKGKVRSYWHLNLYPVVDGPRGRK